MCSTKPKFITLLYFIFIIAYKLLVHLSILNDYGCRWNNDTEPGRVASVRQEPHPCLWNNHLNCCSIVQFLIALDSIHPVAGTGPIFHFPFSQIEEVSKNNVNLATTNQCIPKIENFRWQNFATFYCFATIPWFHDSVFTFDVFRFKTNSNKISSSCQIFSKAFLETDKYAGFCGILHATPPKICNNNHSIRGMIYTDILFSTFYTCITNKIKIPSPLLRSL